jgi:adenylylsulfate kinase-like enzyme
MTGLGSAFERPAAVDLHLSTANQVPADSAAKLLAFALARLAVPRA